MPLGLKQLAYAISGTSIVVKNLRTFLLANTDWDGVQARDFVITISGSVWSNDKSFAAMEILAADFPTLSTIIINNNGLISGKGDSSPAGGAMKVTRLVTVNNVGAINGGGRHVGGSGGGVCINLNNNNADDQECTCCIELCCPGSGGTGLGYGYSSAGSSRTVGSHGADCISSEGCGTSLGGAGGVGGDAGNDGYCINGNNYITWLATGTRNGSIT
jgi:hypothetical protein